MSSADLIQHADGRTFVRFGECNGCLGKAACCQFLMLPLARALSEDEVRWVELHPMVRIDDQNVRIESRCSALDNEGRCTLFGTPKRPEMCVRYPEQPEQLVPGCSYELESVRS